MLCSWLIYHHLFSIVTQPDIQYLSKLVEMVVGVEGDFFFSKANQMLIHVHVLNCITGVHVPGNYLLRKSYNGQKNRLTQ